MSQIHDLTLMLQRSIIFETMSIYALHINALVNFLKRILRNLNNFFKTKESIFMIELRIMGAFDI